MEFTGNLKGSGEPDPKWRREGVEEKLKGSGQRDPEIKRHEMARPEMATGGRVGGGR